MKKKVSIIVIHYNQSEYVKIALDSVFQQSYKEIELIFADDASDDIDLNDLKKYCQRKNEKNFKIVWQINSKNLGTVKSLNQALTKCTGDYVLIFAADDKLYSNDVIEKYVDSFEKQEQDVALIFGQCYMMDKELNKLCYKFIDYNKGEEFNQLSSLGQFKVLSNECFIAMGASMVKRDVLKKIHNFDERYKYVEDYSLFLNLSLNGYKMVFDPKINGLYHRDGGISHRDENRQLEQHHIDFFKDIIKITEICIFPYFNVFDYENKNKIVNTYVQRIRDLSIHGVIYNISAFKKLKKKNLLFFIFKRINKVDDIFKVYAKEKINFLLNMVYLLTCLIYLYNSVFLKENYFRFLIILIFCFFLVNLILFIIRFIYHIIRKIVVFCN